MLVPALILALASSGACSPQALKDFVKAQAKPTKGKIGVSALVLEDGTSFSFHGSRHFPMQSVYKLPIAIAVLHRVETGGLKLDQTVRVEESDLIPPAGHSPLRDKHHQGGEFTVEDLLRRAIVDSDGTASDVLLRVLGGPREVKHYLKNAHINSVRVRHTEAQIIDDTHAQYSDWAKPEGMVQLLSRLQQGRLLNQENTARLLNWMKQTETGRDRVRAKLPAGTEVADKTGGSGTVDGLTPATNDVALVKLPNGKHMAIAIFLSDARASAAQRNSVIADISKQIWDCWSEERR